MREERIPNSFSRELDASVAREEMPYGYTSAPPPADTNDYDSKKLNSTKEITKYYK